MSTKSSDNNSWIWPAAIIIAGIYFWPDGDPNTKPEYGKASGLPANCRAYVQDVINKYHYNERRAVLRQTRQYSTDDLMVGLERNCGVNGHLWGKQK